MKDPGPLGFFLGIQATRNSTSLHLQQSKYVLDLLNKIKMTDAKLYRSPCVSGTKMSKFDGGPLVIQLNTDKWLLLFNTQHSLDRIYPTLSINYAQHMHNPTSTHWTSAKRVLRYLKEFVNCGLLYSKVPLPFTPIVIQIGLVIRMTDDLLVDLASPLALAYFHGPPRNM